MDIREVNQWTLKSERQHWWIVTRFHHIDRALRHLPAKAETRLVEFGCGTGQNLWWLRTHSPHKGRITSVTGVDPHMNESTTSEWKLPGDRLVRKLEDKENFDVMLAMDVLEHIDDDLEALQSWSGSLRPGAVIFLTVPAFNFLWSGHDEFLGHKRRYTRLQLDQLAQKAGLEKTHSSYAFSYVFPLVWLIRRFFRGDGKSGSDLKPPFGPVNLVLKALGRMEALIGGIPFFGTSVIGIYKKP